MTVSNNNQHDVVDLIKSQLSITDVVSKYVDLKGNSRLMKGLCPFYPENTPSFVIYPESQIFKCYCGSCAGTSGGDIFSFVMRIENINFVEALNLCAELAGVKLNNYQPKKTKTIKKDLSHALESAADFFKNSLNSRYGLPASNYLKDRGFSEEKIKEFNFGLSPTGLSTLVDHLKKVGVKSNSAVESGLVQKWADNTWHDFFVDRLTIEIRDEDNNLVGFGGRSLGNKTPKYINTPQTELFNKSELLFGLNLAKEDILRLKECVIVEGYMDVFAAHSEGFNNVVACMGTSLTFDQLNKAKKYAEKIILCLDSDIAGKRASVNNLIKLINSNDNLSHIHESIFIASIGSGNDPDDLIRQNSSQWEKVISDAIPLYKHLINNLDLVFDLTDKMQINDAANIVYKLVFQNKDSHSQDQTLGLLATKLKIEREELPSPKILNSKLSPKPVLTTIKSNDNPIEKHIIALILQNKLLKNYIKEQSNELFSDPKLRAIFDILKSDDDIESINDDMLNDIILDLKSFFLPETNEKDLITELNDCINRLYNHHLKRKKIEQQKAIELGLESNTGTIDSVINDSLNTNKLLKEIQSNQKQ
ncbi:MAG: DNA primase [Chloroflexota bacterium]|nr:DNA primase [Chloroflexota bacterium]